jgi:hypothetical protein
MKISTHSLIVAVAAVAIVFSSFAGQDNQNNVLSKKEKAEGWKLLFDGQSTEGWHLYNGSSQFTLWKVKDGELFCDPNDKTGATDLVTDNLYKNYDLKFDWKLPKGGNSGVFINVLERADLPAAWSSGPEYQLLDDANADFAKPEDRSGCLFSFGPQKTPVKTKPANTWNHSEIKQINGKIQFYLNGTLTTEEDLTSKAWADKIAKSHFKTIPDFGKHLSGHIGLQDWATGISFRNIKIKEF